MSLSYDNILAGAIAKKDDLEREINVMHIGNGVMVETVTELHRWKKYGHAYVAELVIRIEEDV